MASTNTATPAPLGRRRNPYELLKDEDRRRRSLATANHRERIRALAWDMMPAARATPDDAQATFRAIKQGSCRVLELACLLAAEVTANDYPHDLPFHPDDQELGDAIGRNFRTLLQIVKGRIRTGALPVRQGVGVQLGCNADPAVLAWCSDPTSISPPRMLCTTLDDARALAHAIGLNPLRELVGESAPPTEQAPALPPDLESPGRKGKPSKTGRMNAAKKAIREILREAGEMMSKSVAPDAVFRAIRDGRVPAQYRMVEEDRINEAGDTHKVVVWTDTKGKQQTLEAATVRRYALAAWDALYGGRDKVTPG